MTLAEMERKAILKALKNAKGRVDDAAEVLGIDRMTVYRKLKQYEKRKGRKPRAKEQPGIRKRLR